MDGPLPGVVLIFYLDLLKAGVKSLTRFIKRLFLP